jgi:hypothetical protein
MTYISRFRLNVTCTASAAAYSQWVEGGLLHAIRYTPATASGFATGSTVYVTASPLATGPSHDILKFTGTSAAAMLYPRVERHTTAGATGALGVCEIPLAKEHLRLEVQSGGTSGQGQFDFYIEGR